MKKVAFMIFILLIIQGCSYYTGSYLLVLKEVERPENVKLRYGEYKIFQNSIEDEIKYTYEDSMISIIWTPIIDKGFVFQIENKLDHSIKIIWDEAVYIDENGLSNRITHTGVKYLDRNSSQPPSVIARKTKFNDIIIPSNKIVNYDGWKTNPIFENKSYEKEGLKDLSKKYIGKIVCILLPLQIEDVVNEYMFKFSINDFIISSNMSF